MLAGRVGDGYTVIGDTVNVAVAAAGGGPPGDGNRRRGRPSAPPASAISYEQLEPLDLKGKAEPVPAWEASEPVASRQPTGPRSRAAAPLIGRDEEAGLLIALASGSTARDGPTCVTVIGQAGVGKSRLLREFAARVAELDPAPELRIGECPPYGIGDLLLGAGRGDPRPSSGSRAGEAAETRLGEAARRDPGAARRLEPRPSPSERNAAVIALMLGIEPRRGRRTGSTARTRSGCARPSSRRFDRWSRR